MSQDDYSAFQLPEQDPASTSQSGPAVAILNATTYACPKDVLGQLMKTNVSSTSPVPIASSKPSTPFGQTKQQLHQTVKHATVLKNWRAKADPHFGNRLVVTQWIPGKGTSVGVGVSSGVRASASTTFGKEQIQMQAVWYDRETDSWIFQKFIKKGDDSPQKYYRAPFANAYQNEKYHCQNRGEINSECGKAIGMTVY